MGLRLRKIIPLGRGLRINLSKSGLSLSLGRRGASVNLGGKGVRGTLGLPGTGVSWSERLPWSGRAGWLTWVVILAAAGLAAWILLS